MDDEELAKQLSGDIQNRNKGGAGKQLRGMAAPAPPVHPQAQRGAQLQRSVTSDSMGMSAEIADFLADSDEEELVDDDEEGAPDLLRVSLTLAQAEAFAKRTAAVVGAGRLPCPFCGIPIDNTGHLCPRANGYRR